MSKAEIITRHQQKHDIEANWQKAINFIPLAGEFIVYEPDETHPIARYKIGDGVLNPETGKVEGTNVNDLPFIGNDDTISVYTKVDVDNIWYTYVPPKSENLGYEEVYPTAIRITPSPLIEEQQINYLATDMLGEVVYDAPLQEDLYDPEDGHIIAKAGEIVSYIPRPVVSKCTITNEILNGDYSKTPASEIVYYDIKEVDIAGERYEYHATDKIMPVYGEYGPEGDWVTDDTNEQIYACYHSQRDEWEGVTWGHIKREVPLKTEDGKDVYVTTQIVKKDRYYLVYEESDDGGETFYPYVDSHKITVPIFDIRPSDVYPPIDGEQVYMGYLPFGDDVVELGEHSFVIRKEDTEVPLYYTITQTSLKNYLDIIVVQLNNKMDKFAQVTIDENELIKTLDVEDYNLDLYTNDLTISSVRSQMLGSSNIELIAGENDNAVVYLSPEYIDIYCSNGYVNIHDVADPIEDRDAATKNYVDNQIAQIATSELPPLNVTVDENNMASHTPVEIFDYVRQGGKVYFNGWELSNYEDESIEQPYAFFNYVEEEGSYGTYVIYSDGSVVDSYSYRVFGWNAENRRFDTQDDVSFGGETHFHGPIKLHAEQDIDVRVRFQQGAPVYFDDTVQIEGTAFLNDIQIDGHAQFDDSVNFAGRTEFSQHAYFDSATFSGALDIDEDNLFISDSEADKPISQYLSEKLMGVEDGIRGDLNSYAMYHDILNNYNEHGKAEPIYGDDGVTGFNIPDGAIAMKDSGYANPDDLAYVKVKGLKSAAFTEESDYFKKPETLSQNSVQIPGVNPINSVNYYNLEYQQAEANAIPLRDANGELYGRNNWDTSDDISGRELISMNMCKAYLQDNYYTSFDVDQWFMSKDAINEWTLEHDESSFTFNEGSQDYSYIDGDPITEQPDGTFMMNTGTGRYRAIKIKGLKSAAYKDTSEIVQEVLNALPTWEGGSY